MPKRDQAYMDAQRRAIVMAALDVLLEKGVYKTTLRDICQRGNISIGAFYTHFKTIDEVIIAACAVDLGDSGVKDGTVTWIDYVESFREAVLNLRLPYGRKRTRLSLQLVSDQIMATENLPGLSDIYQAHQRLYADALRQIRDSGEISLPYGVEAVAEFHMISFTGTAYMVHANKDIQLEHAADRLVHALSLSVIVRNRVSDLKAAN